MSERFPNVDDPGEWLEAIEVSLSGPKTLEQVAKYGGYLPEHQEWPEHLPKALGPAQSGRMEFEDGSWIDLADDTYLFVTPELGEEMSRRLGRYMP